MSRKAMQVALEALDSDNPDIQLRAAIALRQALETEQEPLYWNVADGWVYADDTSQKRVDEKAKREHEPVAFRNKETGEFCTGGFMRKEWSRWTPLYSAPPKRDLTCVCGAVWEGEMMVHPPRKREWVGLTDDEADELVARFARYELLREVEAKLKEKNMMPWSMEMKEEWLMPGAVVPVDAETTAALVAEIKRLIWVVGGMALKMQPEREWVGLTDQELEEMHNEIKVRLMGTYRTEDIYRSIEAKLREKNT